MKNQWLAIIGSPRQGGNTEKPLSELGIRIIERIEYYSTKNKPVSGNESYKQSMIDSISNLKLVRKSELSTSPTDF